VATRKERERVARESLIVDHARRLLVRDGFQELNLDELARAIEYSKGTIYLHFKTKEDLVLAVLTKTLQERADLLERAAQFKGNTRERMRALSYACCHFVFLHPEYFFVEIMLKSLSFWERASEERRKIHFIETRRIFQIVNSIVTHAVAKGDLPRGANSDEVTLSLIAITIGSHCAVTQHEFQQLRPVKEPLVELRLHQDKMLDGWGWKPLSKTLDHTALDRRIRDEVFPDASWIDIQ
jgi:AcrR family transcriptional regulator